MSRKLWLFIAGGLFVALVLAGVVSNFASSSPDGLDATTLQGCTTDADGNITGGTCIAQQAKDHQLKGGPLANYGIKGIDNPYLSTGLSGVAGVLLTFAIGAGVFWLVRRRGTPASDADDSATGDSATGDVAEAAKPAEPSEPATSATSAKTTSDVRS